jgi:hypothetical protein
MLIFYKNIDSTMAYFLNPHANFLLCDLKNVVHSKVHYKFLRKISSIILIWFPILILLQPW